MGPPRKRRLRSGDQKDKQKQKAARGRHKESQLSLRRLRVMEERKQLLGEAREQWGELRAYSAFLSASQSRLPPA